MGRGFYRPAWTVLLAAAYFVSRNTIVAAVALGVFLQGVAGYCAIRLTEQLGVPRPVS